MLKYIGAGIALLGLVLLAISLITGKRRGIRQAAEELAMITGAGYASDHVAQKKERSPFEQQFATRIKKRRRQLDEESIGIFELVEKERAEKNQPYVEPKAQPKVQKLRKGTDILTSVPTETPAAQIRKKGTDVLSQPQIQKKATDVLPQKEYAEEVRKPYKKSTDILSGAPSQAEKEMPAARRGTDVLPEMPGKGTGVLPASEMAQEESAAPAKAKKGTDVLTLAKKGTDVLTQPDPAGKGTDVLPDYGIPKQPRKGTDVL